MPAPGKVTAELEGSTVVIKWNPVASKVPLAGYLVYRAFPGDDTGAPLNSAPTTDTVWRDRTAKEATTYVFWVVAQTLEGKQSAASAKSKVEIPKTGGVVPFF
ncbi:MAG: fibronectin type III domain-containing protein [Candidatus Coatesbacteria bacterium]